MVYGPGGLVDCADAAVVEAQHAVAGAEQIAGICSSQVSRSSARPLMSTIVLGPSPSSE